MDLCQLLGCIYQVKMFWSENCWSVGFPGSHLKMLHCTEEEEEVEEILSGKKEIRYMPFGGGRRICPGIGISMLHLQYFVGNLIWLLKWDAIGEVDLEEKLEVSIVMKTPLEARISAR